MARDEDITRLAPGEASASGGGAGLEPVTGARLAQEIPTGRISRFMKLSALSAGASTRYFGQRVRGMFQEPEARAEAMLKTHMKTAQKTVEVMGNLKGAVMKVGQMISFNADNGVLPPELTSVFGRLQSQAPTLPYPSIRAQIVRELKEPPEKLFASFDEQPMAAASLGQVHAARLHSGEEVVVKIQYPGIDKTIESDLWQLRSVFKASGLVGRAAEAELIFQEVKERLTEELDYELEAKNLLQFREFFADDPRILIPRYIPELSSRRVLTMERMDGLELEQVLALHPEQAWRNALGATLYDLLLRQLIELRRLHADPQLGNFRFLEDGRVIMLDLGCVKSFDDAFMEPYLDSIEARIRGDRDWMARCLSDLGVLPEGNDAARELIFEFADLVMRPLLEVPYRFADDGQVISELKAIAPRFLAFPEVQGHPDLVFLHRTYLGFFFIVSRLRAEGDWQTIFFQRREAGRQRGRPRAS